MSPHIRPDVTTALTAHSSAPLIPWGRASYDRHLRNCVLFRRFCPNDKLRAGVEQPDWFDPALVSMLAAFCAHYGVASLPTRPYMPRHNRKCECARGGLQRECIRRICPAPIEETRRRLAAFVKITIV
jgi:hypothetical protein